MEIEILRNIISSWVDELNISCSVYLFGSYARGTSTEDSDIDIAIEILDELTEDEETNIHYFESYKWERYLSEKIGSKVNIEFLKGEKTSGLEQALNESSILLYSRYVSPKTWYI